MFIEKALKLKMEIRKSFYRFCIKALYKFKYRFFLFDPYKGIGHQSTEPACFIIEKKLKLINYKIIIVFLTPSDYYENTRNIALFKLWKNHFSGYIHIGDTPESCSWKQRFFTQLYLTLEHYPKYRKIKLNNNYHVLSKTISNRAMELNSIYKKPLLKITKKMQKRGTEILEALGIEPGSWFVLFHNREPTFMNSLRGKPYEYEKLYGHRNDSHDLYDKALEFILNKGGYCIRFGHYQYKLNEKHTASGKIIDYPFSRYHSQETDIFLMQNCRFYLGANSGPAQTVGYFGNPVVQVNGTPFIGLPYFSFDIGLPKLYYSTKLDRLLHFHEIIEDKVLLNSNDINDFKKAQIEFISNTQEEIFEACVEMINRLENTEIDTEEDIRLQEKFKSLFSPVDYCFAYPGRIGKSFLKKYCHLLEKNKKTELVRI